MLLYSVSLLATPGPDADPPKSAETKPAQASCWVLAEDPDAALRTLTTALLDGHWIPGRVRSIRTIDPARVPENDPSRQYITEAIETGCTIVIHTESDEDDDSPDPAADEPQPPGDKPGPDEPPPQA